MSDLQIVIVEDEPVTARNLYHIIKTVAPGANLLATLPSVQAAVGWFAANGAQPQLIFMDIRLADGVSFDIFKQTAITQPVIFVTAYHEHAIQAFKNNGIDYILKPFDEAEIAAAIAKYRNFTTIAGNQQQMLDNVLAALGSINKTYKRSFLVHYRDKLLPLEAGAIQWFYTANEVVYAHTADKRQFVIEHTMEQLQQVLNPQLFFRANRQFIINKQAVVEADFFFNSRLSIKVNPEPPERILISKARVPEFKHWMNM